MVCGLPKCLCGDHGQTFEKNLRELLRNDKCFVPFCSCCRIFSCAEFQINDENSDISMLFFLPRSTLFEFVILKVLLSETQVLSLGIRQPSQLQTFKHLTNEILKQRHRKITARIKKKHRRLQRVQLASITGFQ